MSALGHEQTSRHVRVMSVIPLKADIHQRGLHVRLVPLADIQAVVRHDGLLLLVGVLLGGSVSVAWVTWPRPVLMGKKPP